MTLHQIIETAMKLAAHEGLEAITIGRVAELMNLSKSGVFSRVGSREQLQCAVLEAYDRRFAQAVILPAQKAPAGLERLKAMLVRWAERMGRQREDVLPCLLASGAFEYDDRPGPVRELVKASVSQLRAQLDRHIREAIELRQLDADTDPALLAFQLHSLMLGAMHDRRLLSATKSAQRAAQAALSLLAIHRPQPLTR